MGLASIIAGALNPYLVHKFGRNRASWLGLGLFAAGIVMFVYCPPVQLTLLATLLGGIGTSTVINNMVTSISHHYKEDAAIALPQSNSIGSAGYVLGTLLVGTLAGTSLSWRYGLLLAAPLSLILYIFGREKNTEEHVPDLPQLSGQLHCCAIELVQQLLSAPSALWLSVPEWVSGAGSVGQR
jgi:MFS family permease